MKLWILDKQAELPTPVYWGYDCAQGFVIIAETEQQAREFANEQAGDESEEIKVWLDPRYTECLELTPESYPAGIILRDFREA